MSNKKMTNILGFVHSEVQDYEGDPAVKEIIISVNGNVIAKLKAVKTSTGMWEANVRNNHGVLIYNHENLYATYMQALETARLAYKDMLDNAYRELFNYTTSLYKQEVTT